MQCPNCGTQVDDSVRFCGNCGHQMQGQATSSRAPSSAAAPSPASSILPSNVLPSNAAPGQPQIMLIKAGKNSGLAAVLSFLWCGLGQIYNGQVLKGVIFGVIYFISALLIFAVIGLLTTPILWIWGMVDAYRTSERLNREAGLV
jgi:TM2 domain-containing membrane protein YozV